MAGLDYFYDSQTRSYLKQILAVFHGFKYKYYLRDGSEAYKQVPIRLGTVDRMVESIVRNNSENIIRSAPIMTISIRGMVMSDERRQNPSHVDTIQVSEREFDKDTGQYTTNVGNKYTVQRFMPVPIDMQVQLDVWTTNLDQKLQLFEQIIPLFNPTLDLQANTNALDWSSLTYMHMEDINWSSRSIPIGTSSNSESMDVLTINFKIPIWINTAAKVQKQTVIHQIIQNIVAYDADCFGTGEAYIDGSDLLSRMITTPAQHEISIDGDEITLLGEGGKLHNANDEIYNWVALLDQYGNFRPGVTQLRIKKFAPNIDTEQGDVVGVIELHPTEVNKLLWTVDITTLPSNTINAVSAIINPRVSYPGAGLPIATTGQRYLLVNEIGGQDGPNGEDGSTVGWGHLVADVNDIIQYNGTTWSVIFDANQSTTDQFVLNSFTEKQLHWNGSSWTTAIDGGHEPGLWRLYF